MTEALDAWELKNAMGALARDWDILFFERTDSTGLEARRAAAEGRDRPALIVAAEQTAGRGRLGRSFYSPNGTGVYVTFLFPVRGRLSDMVSLTCASAVAVMRAIRKTVGKQTEIKWVNDLYWRERKVCGILAESFCVGARTYLTVGIGINLRPCAFPPALSQIAGSLEDSRVKRSDLIASVAEEMVAFLYRPTDTSWLSDYRAHSLVLGKRVYWERNGERREGVAEEIYADGGLAVREDHGETSVLRTGEITLRLLEK